MDSEMEEMVDSKMEEIMEVELTCKGLPAPASWYELCGFLFEDEAIPSAWSCSIDAAAVPVGAAAAVAG